jgi:hypothetical protein
MSATEGGNMRGTLVHLVTAGALAAGIGVFIWAPNLFAPETGDTFTVIAPAKRPLQTVVYTRDARRPRKPAPAKAGSSSPAGDTAVAVASRPSARSAQKRGLVGAHSSRSEQPRTLACERPPVNEKADIQTFQRRDDTGDAPPSQARRTKPALKARAAQARPAHTPFRRRDDPGDERSPTPRRLGPPE